jgi:peptidoglycan/LPS O-acetylase OafA/YrhL
VSVATAPAVGPSRPQIRRPRAVEPGLNGIRAFAAIGIVLEHTTALTLPPDSAVSNPLRASLVLFVILSGFLNYRPWVQAHVSGKPSPDTRTFLVRRMLRVFPLYWTVLAVYLLVRGWGEISSALDLAKVVFLLQTFDKRLVFAGVGPAWTLSVEFTFYLMIPLFSRGVRWMAGWLGSADARGRLIGELVAVSLFWMVGPTVRLAFGVGERYVTDVASCADMLATGMFLAIAAAWVSEGNRLPDGVARWVLSRWSALLALALVVGVWVWLPSPLPPLPQAPATISVFRIGSALILGATLMGTSLFAPEDHPVRRFLSVRPLQAIAVLSFGIYLWHVLVLDELVDVIGAYTPSMFLPLTYCTLVFSISLSLITYFGVQVPFESVRRRVRFAARPPKPVKAHRPGRPPFAIPAGATDMLPLAGYRAVAATLVVVGHIMLAARVEQRLPLASPFHSLAVVVPMFFGLAGYVAYRPFVHANLTGAKPPGAARYIWKRIVRIYFLYVIALTVYLWAVPFFRPDTFVEYVQLYTLTQIYNPELLQKGLPAAWFEAALFPLYIAMPAFAAGARAIARRNGMSSLRQRLHAEIFMCGIIIAVSVVCRAILIAGQVEASTTWPISYADYVGIGMLVAIASVWAKGGGRLPSFIDLWRRHPNVSLFFLIATILVFERVNPPVNGPFTLDMQLFRFTAYFVMVGLILVPAVLSGPFYWLNRLMATFPMVILGRGSYSTYIWHQLVLVAIAYQFGATIDSSMLWWFLFAGIVLSNAVGLVSCVVLEGSLENLKDYSLRDRSGAVRRNVPVPGRPTPSVAR